MMAMMLMCCRGTHDDGYDVAVGDMMMVMMLMCCRGTHDDGYDVAVLPWET